MGRKRNTLVREFFDYRDDESLCKICRTVVKGSFLTNLRRHMITKHPKEYEEHEKECKNVETNGEEKRKVSFMMSENTLMNACINFVTKEALPLTFFDSPSFKTIAGPIFESLGLPPVSSRNVSEIVKNKYLQKKEILQNILKGKIMSLKIDTASRLDRSVLGVNIQLILNNKIEVYTLGMIELHRRHTAVNLKREVEDILEEFAIKKAQIYTITTDNGRNMVKAAQLLSSSEDEDADSDDIYHPDGESGAIIYDQIINSMSFDQIRHIRCAAHTLQLASKDFLNDFENKIINRARNLSKTLRTPNYRFKIREAHLKNAILDVTTRWSATYEMLRRLLELREFCHDSVQTTDNLTPEEWETIEEICRLLEPMHAATIKFQNSQLLMADFYKFWIELKFKIKAISTPMSKALVNCLEKREKAVLEHDVMYSALFLDPRLRGTLTKEKKASAKKHLRTLFLQIYAAKNEHQRTESTTAVSAQASTSKNCLDNSLLFDETSTASSTHFLKECVNSLNVSDASSDDETDLIPAAEILMANNEIDTFHSRADIDVNLSEFWSERRYSMPNLTKLAFVVQAVPATQVSVERAFSALRIVLDRLRYNLSPETMKMLLFLKLNNLP